MVQRVISRLFRGPFMVTGIGEVTVTPGWLIFNDGNGKTFYVSSRTDTVYMVEEERTDD